MSKVLTAALLVLVATTGSAMADRWHGGNNNSNRTFRDNRDNRTFRDNRTVVRDNRRIEPRRDNRIVVRDHRNDTRVIRQPVYVNNNRYTFHDGRVFNYQRPVINYRYTNYRYRPSILVENYETTPGYLWVAGSWSWNGYEWLWVSGHYEVDSRYQNTGYDTGYGYDNGYDNGYSYAPASNGYQEPCD